MTVCLVNADLLPVPPVLGGAIEHTIYETAVAIRRPRLKVISPWAKALKGRPDQDCDTFYHVDIAHQEARFRKALGKRTWALLAGTRNARPFHYLNGVTDLLESIDPDVIQVHNRPEFVPYLVDQFPEKPVVLYQHNQADYRDSRVRQGFERCHRLVSVSEFLAGRFKKVFPAVADRSCVVHNGVDTRAWHPDLRDSERVSRLRERYGLPAGRTVLFVGRTVPAKGLAHLLDAMGLVTEVVPDTRLLVVGSPLFGAVGTSGYLERLKRQAARLGSAVIFTGFVDRCEMPVYYAVADVAVAPSVWEEPFGKVVIEAMASCLPVIGSNRGAIPEIVEHGVDGLLVDEPENARELAFRIIGLIGDPDRRAVMGANGRRKAVERFSTRLRLSRTRAFYATLT